jgi:peptidoglycan/xylan/chitin deacetylase (PgdA/CDA1 family)
VSASTAAYWLGRARRGWRRARLATLPRGSAPVILMYHRIAQPPCDPWGMALSPTRFAEHLEWLARNRTVLSLDALVGALEEGVTPPRATAITFDDGYADNARVAKPMLEAAGLPATMFLTSGFAGSGRAFWWDELEHMTLLNPSAVDFEFALGSESIGLRWHAEGDVPPDLSAWRAGDEPTDERCDAFRRLYYAVQPLPAEERDRILARLGAQLGGPGVQPESRAMSATDVAALASAHISVGGHGRSHTPLTSLGRSERELEIASGKAELEHLTRKSVTGFSYPHGRSDPRIRAQVAQAGYRWAVGSDAAAIDPRRFDRFALPRLEVRNWSADELARAIARIGG